MKPSVKNSIRQIFKKTVFKRRAFFFITDILLISLSMYVSFWLRFNGVIPLKYKESLLYFILLALYIKLIFLMLFNLYDISWRYVGLEELIKLFKALSISSLFLGMVLFTIRLYEPFKNTPFPRSILLLDYLISLFLIGLIRISKRSLIEGVKSTLKSKGEKVNTLIIGAGSAAEQIVREVIRNKNSNYFPIGFIDDDPAKQGVKIHGIKVLGKREDIPKIIRDNDIDEALIAIPSAPSKEIRAIVRILRESKPIENIKILPGVTDLINGKVTLSDIHKVELEDLLGRETVTVDTGVIKDFIYNKKILITGAAGSIGSVVVKSILSFNPKSLFALDMDETGLFYLIRKIGSSKLNIHPIIGDIRNEMKMKAVFAEHSPQIVFHAAAYKHVPILELYPDEAIRTNIFGTKILADLSLKYNVQKFIFISSDKAINPTSIMGATKRCAEELLRVLDRKESTEFVSVRFGNVLGSRGSVIPLFEEQIKKGGPVTVTHPEMKRYFMVTSEAVLLVLEAAAIGQGGEVFILDMGNPIKIIDIAKEMIRLSGYEPDKDIPIIFTHIRPGEKLFEEILAAEEGTETTKYEKILKARSLKVRDTEFLMKKINQLIKMSNKNNKKSEIIKLLKEIIPTYRPSNYKTPSILW